MLFFYLVDISLTECYCQIQKTLNTWSVLGMLDIRTNKLIIGFHWFSPFYLLPCFVNSSEQLSTQPGSDQICLQCVWNDDMALLSFMNSSKSMVNRLTNWFMPTIFSHLSNLLENSTNHSPICVPFGILNNLFSHSVDLFKRVSKPFACLCSPFGKLNNPFSQSIALFEWVSKPLVTCSITVFHPLNGKPILCIFRYLPPQYFWSSFWYSQRTCHLWCHIQAWCPTMKQKYR